MKKEENSYTENKSNIKRKNKKNQIEKMIAVGLLIAIIVLSTGMIKMIVHSRKSEITGSKLVENPVGSNENRETIEADTNEQKENVEKKTLGNKRFKDQDNDLELLQIVNEEQPLKEELDLDLEELPTGEQVAREIYEPLMQMLEDGEREGLSFFVCSGYRSIAEQEVLFEDKVRRVREEGYTQEEAYDRAKQEVAVPGGSEHQLGLTVDIVAENYQLLEDSQAYTPESEWLKEHCSEYGFILRYPIDTTNVTGIIFEPWHYRYVGKEAAKEIMESNETLEEYVQQKFKE